MYKKKVRLIGSIVLLILLAHFLGAGRLTGDALTIFEQMGEIKFSDLIPRRFFLYSYIWSFSSGGSFLLNFLGVKDTDYILQFFIAQSGSLLWLLSVILATASFREFKSNNISLFVIFFFFTTPVFYFSNELIHEGFIVFFLCLFFYLKSKSSYFAKAGLLISVFMINFIKIYFIPLTILLIFVSKKFSKKQLIILLPLLLSINIFTFFYPQFFLGVKRMQYENVTEFGTVLYNFYLYFFSLNFGFTASFHIFSILFIWMFATGSRLLLGILALNFGYLIFFSFLPFWHGDMIGSRYMLPISVVNFFFLVDFLYSKKFFHSGRSILFLFLTMIWIVSFSTSEYRVTSFNRFYDCSASSYIVNEEKRVLDKKRVNLFTYSDYPYFELSLNNIFFSNYVSMSKLSNRSQSLDFLNKQVSIKLDCIYPRKTYSLLLYLNKNIDFKLERIIKNLGDFSGEYLNRFLYIMILISTVFGLFSPYLLVRLLSYKKVEYS